MPELPRLQSLPTQPTREQLKDVALRVAELAQVPAIKCERFCEEICHKVQRVWLQDRRAVPSKPGRALLRAADAARVLHEAFWSLNEVDREWVKRITAGEPDYQELLRPLRLTVSQIDDLLSIAVGRFIPRMPASAVLRYKAGRRKGDRGDAMFVGLIQSLVFSTAIAGGKLTFDKNYKKGTLVEVLKTLRPHLPRGVVPNALNWGTIQKVKTKTLKDLRHFLALRLPAYNAPSPLDQI